MRMEVKSAEDLDPRRLAESKDLVERLRLEASAQQLEPQLVDCLLDPEYYFASTGRLMRGKFRIDMGIAEARLESFFHAASLILG